MKLLLILIGIGAVFWGVTLWKAARHEARAEAAYPPLGEIIEVDGHALHYVQAGAGPDVVLIHGASGNVRDFTFDLMGRLADAGFRVTVFDRPGLGYTDRPDRDGASIFEQAAFLNAGARQIGLQAPVVLGHSYGGAVALAWATRHQGDLSALVLLAAASNPWPGPLSLYYRVLSHPLGQAVAAPLLTAWVPDHVVTDAIGQVFAPQDTPEGYADYIGAGLTLRRASLRENALQRASILSEVREMVPDYGGIDLPTEILHGTADTTVGLRVHSEPLAGQIEGANLVRMEGIGHSPHQSEPEVVVEAVIRAATRAGLR
jgi:pimeloyl-ACP methyl ester carboxylesterase